MPNVQLSSSVDLLSTVHTAAGSRSGGGRGRGSGVLKNQAGKIWGLVGKARHHQCPSKRGAGVHDAGMKLMLSADG